MKDRVPLYPGRVTLKPVSGQANTFDLTRADQPTQEGTPLNKASLLKDATAALYGLPNTAVPDDVLSKIKTLIDSANANANTKARIATGSYTGTGTYGKSNPNSLTFDFEPKLLIVGQRARGLHARGNSNRWYDSVIWIFGQEFAEVYSDTGAEVYFSVSGNTISWYGTTAANQLNYGSAEYIYFAIG